MRSRRTNCLSGMGNSCGERATGLFENLRRPTEAGGHFLCHHLGDGVRPLRVATNDQGLGLYQSRLRHVLLTVWRLSRPELILPASAATSLLVRDCPTLGTV